MPWRLEVPKKWVDAGCPAYFGRGSAAITASGANSEIDLSMLATFTTTNANVRSGLATNNGGRIRHAVLTSLDRIDLTVGGPMETGQLNIKIGGLNPGSQFDQLNITGRATLGGTLRITVVNNFTPNVGNTFKIVTIASRTGTFAMILGLNIRPGVIFTTGFNERDLTLTVNNG